jgi:hypothetical protein
VKKKARQAAKEKSGSSAMGSTPATLAAIQMEPEVNIPTSIPSQTPGLQESDGSDNEVDDEILPESIGSSDSDDEAAAEETAEAELGNFCDCL